MYAHVTLSCKVLTVISTSLTCLQLLTVHHKILITLSNWQQRLNKDKID